MKQKAENTDNRTNKLLAKLAAEKKKAVLALCLVTLMVFMWIKVIAKKAPLAAEATVTTQQENSSNKTNSQPKISFIELPKVPGRNDQITRDFFNSNDLWAFIRNNEGTNSIRSGEISVTSKDGRKNALINLTGRLKLEAIELGDNPRAFINGKLLSAGDKLSLRSGADTYEFEVIRIEKDIVYVKCAEVEITLRLTQMIEVTD
jgi:hypothetical protein